MKTITYKGYHAQVMESNRLVGEEAHNLPPGNALEVYPADSFNIYPENWIIKGAFVIPVNANKGLWFNFRMNDENNTAILMTIKGCNPITGLQSSGFHLDKYFDKCPKHSCDFVSERFCPECGYKWPDRSYLSGAPLWWDGYVSEGVVRQFFFTEDMVRDVATHMIGKENTVPAFGFAFYSPKEKRVPQPSIMRGINTVYMNTDISKLLGAHQTYYSSNNNSDGIMGLDGIKGPDGISGSEDLVFGAKPIIDSLPNHLMPLGKLSKKTSNSRGLKSYTSSSMMGEAMGDEVLNSMSLKGYSPSIEPPQKFTPQKEVSVGAGAKIRQELPIDTYALDTWKDTPDSVMTIYFVFQEEFNRMAAGGFKDFNDCKDGMLKGLPVG